ncbi:MAG: cupredoxin domain-containing protein [Myxococcales bacterium]|nr:cupredoxin domain-containing protein [Myxococcales bacterium]
MKKQILIISLLSIAGCKGKSNAPEHKAEASQPAPPPAKAEAAATTTTDGSIAITVDGEGYHPSTINAPAGKKATLVFTRTADKSCGTEVVFPSLNIKKDLPLNEPITIEIDVPASGQIAFACGMDMMKGSIVAQ